MIHKEISFGYDYDADNKILIAWDAIAGYGLFSTFTLLLSATTACHAKYESTPNEIVFGNSLSKFNEGNEDLYKYLFNIDTSIEIPPEDKCHVGPDNHHVIYSGDQLKKLQPFFKKYFSLNEETNNVKLSLEDKYDIKDKHRISTIYRGSDKWTDFGGFNSLGPAAYLRLTEKIFESDKTLKVLIQTEDKRVSNWFCSRFHGQFIEETSIGDVEHNRDPIPKEDKLNWLRNYVASLYIHGESEHIITYTGNSGYFVALIKGETENLHQEITFTKGHEDFFVNGH